MREVGVAVTGRLIAFEGIDGSGLSTHAGMLCAYLQDVMRIAAFLAKEPTDGPAGGQVRLKLRGRLAMDQSTLALLFAADRLDHLATDILPRLRAGVHVVCDRYVLSSLAYQSLDLDVDWLRCINARSPKADLTIYLDVPADVCLQRLVAQRWNLEFYETEDRLSRVRQNYLRLISEMQQAGEKVVVVSGMAGDRARSVADVAKDVGLIVVSFLASGGTPPAASPSGAPSLPNVENR